MKASEIFTSNEETEILDHIKRNNKWHSYNQREKNVINNLVRRGLVTKRKEEGEIVIIQNCQ